MNIDIAEAAKNSQLLLWSEGATEKFAMRVGAVARRPAHTYSVFLFYDGTTSILI